MLSGVSSSVPTFIVPPGVSQVRRDQDGPRLSQHVPAYNIIILLGSNDHNVNKQFDGVLSSL